MTDTLTPGAIEAFTALDVADRLIERAYGTDVPAEWNDAYKEVQEARAQARSAPDRGEVKPLTAAELDALASWARPMRPGVGHCGESTNEMIARQRLNDRLDLLDRLIAQARSAPDREAVETAIFAFRCASTLRCSDGFAIPADDARWLADQIIALLGKPAPDSEADDGWRTDLENAMDGDPVDVWCAPLAEDGSPLIPCRVPSAFYEDGSWWARSGAHVIHITHRITHWRRPPSPPCPYPHEGGAR